MSTYQEAYSEEHRAAVQRARQRFLLAQRLGYGGVTLTILEAEALVALAREPEPQ